MRFSIFWTNGAQDDLAAIWADATDRSAVSAAADAVDAMLTTHPETKSESRDAVVRILFKSPLGIEFEVFPDDLVVKVLTVWRITRD